MLVIAEFVDTAVAIGVEKTAQNQSLRIVENPAGAFFGPLDFQFAFRNFGGRGRIVVDVGLFRLIGQHILHFHLSTDSCSGEKQCQKCERSALSASPHQNVHSIVRFKILTAV